MDDKDLDAEKLVADAADVSPVIDYRKRTDAVFGAERNQFCRLVVLQRRVSFEGTSMDGPMMRPSAPKLTPKRACDQRGGEQCLLELEPGRNLCQQAVPRPFH